MTKFKEFKKTVATVLAAAMVFSPITSSVAFAADVTTDPAKDSVSSSGTTEGYVEQEAFSVVLPTVDAERLKFTLDPQGLLTVSGNDTKYATVSAGDVVFKNKISVNSSYGKFNESNVIYATNKSSYDVTFSVDVTMTNGTSTNQVTFVSSADLVTSGNDLNIYMAAVPEKNYISYADVSGNSFVAVSSNASSVSFALDESGAASLAYKIPGVSSNYTISKNGTSYNYVQKADATGWNVVGFTLTGKCNPNADWKAFDSEKTELKLSLAWTLTKASGSEEDYVSSNNPDGLIKGVGATVAYGVWQDGQTYITSDEAGNNTFAGLTNASQITNFKLNGVTCAFTVDTYGFISVTDAQAQATNPTGDVWTFTFTYNNQNYKVVVE